MSRIEFVIDKLMQLHQRQNTNICNQENTNSNSSVKLSHNALQSDVAEDILFEKLDSAELLKRAENWESVYSKTSNRYQKIKAALYLSHLYGYSLPEQGKLLNIGAIPYNAVAAMENQLFDDAIDILNCVKETEKHIPEAVMKILGLAYWSKAFREIEEQVKVCIKARVPEIFKMKSIHDYKLKNPLHFKDAVEQVCMPVRIEHTSCVGSDIFFLAMDRPEKAMCINISVNLFDAESKRMEPPIRVLVRPISEKGIRLTSVDLAYSKLIVDMDDLFNMRNDDLALLKAAVIVSGIIPPALKGREQEIPLLSILEKFMSENSTYNGFEVISRVVDIPRGSGLAVSTNLIAALIMALMRFSGQISCKITDVSEKEKLMVAERCIYGEWLGGSGGGWQDYGGMWGGFKIITGQAADPKYDPESAGSLLPCYRELDLSDDCVEKIFSSLTLVNGGTGQDVGPVLRMITEQYILKDKIAWNARLRTEDRFPQILNALKSGNIKLLGQLESEDFRDRTLISSLSNNLFHQKVFDQLKLTFRDDLWGYDSTGGRAGAGGIFFVNPERRKEFENAFVTISKKIQEDLKGQIRFSSAPMIHSYEINKKGISILTIKRDEADSIVTQWSKSRVRDRKTNRNEQDVVDAIKKQCSYNRIEFEELQARYKSGNLSIRNNIRAVSSKIKNIRLDHTNSSICIMPEIGAHEYDELFHKGINFLNEPLAYIVLNGGESTRFGAHTVRGLNPAFSLLGKYYSPIELKMRHANFLNKKYNCPIYPVLLNSFFTHKHTMNVLQKNQYFGLPKDNVFSCVHHVSHRVYPKVEDLIFWHEELREKGLTEVEEDLANQYIESMKMWAKKNGEGDIYHPVGINKMYTLVSPGHFYSFMSVVTSYILGFLLDKGVKRLVVSCNDNLLATVDPAILAFHIQNGRGATAEVVPRLFDKGGAPVLIDDRVVILEDFSFPDKETLWNTPFFNPITTWIEVDALLNLLKLEKDDLIEAAYGNPQK
ncbi:MAG: UTP--glucose-1-phosphate uridylyltransferase, partial [Bacillota bacterium]|nr:UTP--glucose-1-phosphate uridylyltransferase [Bacillota bacterium]